MPVQVHQPKTRLTKQHGGPRCFDTEYKSACSDRQQKDRVCDIRRDQKLKTFLNTCLRGAITSAKMAAKHAIIAGGSGTTDGSVLPNPEVSPKWSFQTA